MKTFRSVSMRGPARMQGLSLIELMIAMLLGLLVVGAAIGIFLTNKRTYTATESLGRVQENVRTAFEMMSQDVREAGGNPCVNNLPIVNVLNSPGANWWSNLNNWGDGIRGFGGTDEFADMPNGTDPGDRVDGTGALQLLASDDRVTTIEAHNAVTGVFTVNNASPGYAAGDLLLACNSSQASLFQASGVAGANITYAASGSPGNCTIGLGLPFSCAAGTSYEFATPTSVLVRLSPVRWYIGNNARGGTSLYQSRLQFAGGAMGTVNEEVAEGVTNIQTSFLMAGANEYVGVAGVTNWAAVTSLRITLTLQSTGSDGEERIGTDGQPIERQLVHVVSLRNRNA